MFKLNVDGQIPCCLSYVLLSRLTLLTDGNDCDRLKQGKVKRIRYKMRREGRKEGRRERKSKDRSRAASCKEGLGRKAESGTRNEGADRTGQEPGFTAFHSEQ